MGEAVASARWFKIVDKAGRIVATVAFSDAEFACTV